MSHLTSLCLVRFGKSCNLRTTLQIPVLETVCSYCSPQYPTTETNRSFGEVPIQSELLYSFNLNSLCIEVTIFLLDFSLVNTEQHIYSLRK